MNSDFVYINEVGPRDGLQNQKTILSANDRLKLIKYLICLLYTSPSPRDRTRSRMPSSA